jgi:hypothetical protein
VITCGRFEEDVLFLKKKNQKDFYSSAVGNEAEGLFEKETFCLPQVCKRPVSLLRHNPLHQNDTALGA